MNKRTGSQNITRTRTTEHVINIMILNTNTHAHTHSCRKHCKHGGCATTPAKGGERRALLTHQFHSRVCVTKNQSPCGLGGTVAGAKADCHHEAGLQCSVWPGPGSLILISFPVFVLLWFWKKADMEVCSRHRNQNYSEHALQHRPEARPWMLFTLLWLVNSDSVSSKVQFKQVHFTPEGWWLVWMQTRLFPLSFSISDCFIITPKRAPSMSPFVWNRICMWTKPLWARSHHQREWMIIQLWRSDSRQLTSETNLLHVGYFGVPVAVCSFH